MYFSELLQLYERYNFYKKAFARPIDMSVLTWRGPEVPCIMQGTNRYLTSTTISLILYYNIKVPILCIYLSPMDYVVFDHVIDPVPSLV